MPASRTWSRERSPARGGPVPPQKGRAKPSSPLAFGRSDWTATLRRTLAECRADRVFLTAGGLAYFWFLSIFPALVASVGFLALLDTSPAVVDAVGEAIRTVLPAEAASVLTDAIAGAEEGSKGTFALAGAVGLVVAIWSASSGMVGLQRGLDVAYDVPRQRRFLKARAIALVLLLATAVLGGAASALLVFGDPLGELIRDAFPLGDMFLVAWNTVRWVGTIVAIMVLFALYYYVAPNRGAPRWTWVSPGGILATVLWVLASLGFSFYVSSFGSYARTYGAIAGVVVLLLWLFVTALAVLLGGELNAELERQRQLHREGKA